MLYLSGDKQLVSDTPFFRPFTNELLRGLVLATEETNVSK